LIAFSGFLGFLGLALADRPGASLESELRLGPSRLDLFGRGIAIAAYFTFLGAASSVFPPDPTPVVVGQTASASPVQLSLAFVTIAVAPAIGEEIFFRGYLLRKLERTVGPNLAIVGSAAAFGLLHIRSDIAIIMFLMGLYLGFLARTSESIRGPIIAHFLGNAVYFARATA
jgi:membrane protease YdiL (CAAX protease family)